MADDFPELWSSREAIRSHHSLVAADRSDNGDIERQVHRLSDLLLERSHLRETMRTNPNALDPDWDLMKELTVLEASIRDAAAELTPNLKDLK